jgi:hypothetical protein
MRNVSLLLLLSVLTACPSSSEVTPGDRDCGIVGACGGGDVLETVAGTWTIHLTDASGPQPCPTFQDTKTLVLTALAGGDAGTFTLTPDGAGRSVGDLHVESADPGYASVRFELSDRWAVGDGRTVAPLVHYVVYVQPDNSIGGTASATFTWDAGGSNVTCRYGYNLTGSRTP